MISNAEEDFASPIQGHVEAHEEVAVFRESGSGEQCDLRVEVANVGRGGNDSTWPWGNSGKGRVAQRAGQALIQKVVGV